MFGFHRGQNMGAIPLKGMTTKDGKQMLLLRSQCMPDYAEKGSALKVLLQKGDIKHMCNLYGGHYPIQEWLDMEVSLCAQTRKKDKSHLPTHFDERQSTVTRGWRNMVADVANWTE